MATGRESRQLQDGGDAARIVVGAGRAARRVVVRTDDHDLPGRRPTGNRGHQIRDFCAIRDESLTLDLQPRLRELRLDELRRCRERGGVLGIASADPSASVSTERFNDASMSTVSGLGAGAVPRQLSPGMLKDQPQLVSAMPATAGSPSTMRTPLDESSASRSSRCHDTTCCRAAEAPEGAALYQARSWYGCAMACPLPPVQYGAPAPSWSWRSAAATAALEASR